MGTDMIGERLAKLEQRGDTHDKHIERHDNDIEKIADSLAGIRAEVIAIRLKLEKSMSFVGGIAFTFSLLGGILAAFGQWLLTKMGVI